MGLTKSDLFTAEQNTLATVAKALGHPARIAIIQHLIQSKECINGDLVSELGLAQATISQHLKELKSIGIIQGTIDGASVNYCIHPEKWAELKTIMNSFFDGNKENGPQNCC